MSTCRYFLGKQLWLLHKKTTYQQFSNIRRFFKRFASEQCWPKQNNPSADSLLESWYYEVKTFGLLKIKLPFNAQIKSLSPETHPKMNRVIVQIVHVSDDTESIDKKMFLPPLYDLNTHVCKETNEVEITVGIQKGVTLPIECLVQAPIKMNLQIESENGSVAVSDFENEFVSINLQKGMCVLNNLKSGKISVANNGGSIISNQVLQANIDLQSTTKGGIKVHKLQGTSVLCKANEGDIHIQDLYADSSNIHTDCGTIDIGSCHGDTEVSVDQGNLKIASLDGNLRASVKEGQTDVYVSRHEDVMITCGKGDITLKYSDTTESKLELIADAVFCDQQIQDTLQETPLANSTTYKGFINKESANTIKVSTQQGSITLAIQDWLASIGLKQTP